MPPGDIKARANVDLSERFFIKPSEEILADNKVVSGEMKERIRRNVSAIQRGEVLVEDGSVPGLEKQFTTMAGKMKPLEELLGRLTRPPSDVSVSPLRDATLLGAYVQGTLVGKSWTGLGRVYQHPALGIVVLNEADLFAGSARLTMAAETMNFPVGGQPGWFVARHDPRSGLSSAQLRWVDKSGISYEMLTGKPDETGRQAMREIAESIRP
jgi:hypothetical protein